MKKLLHKMQPRTLTTYSELLFLHFTEMRLFQPLRFGRANMFIAGRWLCFLCLVGT